MGQGDVRTTPLQVAVAYAALANGGRVLKPYVVNRVIRSDGSIVRESKPTVVDTLADHIQFLDSINEGLRQAVHDEEFGTGYLATVKDSLIGGRQAQLRFESWVVAEIGTSFGIFVRGITLGLRHSHRTTPLRSLLLCSSNTVAVAVNKQRP